MPTLNPRVNVTLSPTLHSLVDDLATLQRVSKATVLRELLESVEPALVQIVAMMKAAQDLEAASKGRLSKHMATAIKEAEQGVQMAMGAAVFITDDLVGQAESIRGRRPSRRSGASRASTAPHGAAPAPGLVPPVAKKPRTPLISNRGVKS